MPTDRTSNHSRPSPRPLRGLIGAAALAASMAGAGVARAEDPRVLQVAAPPAPAQAAVDPGPDRGEMAMIRLEVGTAVIPSRVPGMYGRYMTEYLSVFDRRRPSFAWGFWGGWEGFRAGGVWGLECPLSAFVAVKSPRVLAAIAGGANAFGIGAVDGKFGGGLFQPRAQVRLGFHVGKVFFSATSDVQVRWGWGHAAQVVLTTGVSVGIMFEQNEQKKR